MPFAHVQYRALRNSPMGYIQRRNRFLCITISYAVFFIVVGAVFLGLYINQLNSLNTYNCSICAYLGTPYPCGSLYCCDGSGFYSYSFQFCLGNYALSIFFIIMLVCFCYAVYEILMIICLICQGTALQNSIDVVVVDSNNQQYLANNYNDPYANNNYQNYPPNNYPPNNYPVNNRNNGNNLVVAQNTNLNVKPNVQTPEVFQIN